MYGIRNLPLPGGFARVKRRKLASGVKLTYHSDLEQQKRGILPLIDNGDSY